MEYPAEDDLIKVLIEDRYRNVKKEPKPMRHFVFIEIEEGGARDYGPIEETKLGDELYKYLRGWLDPDCRYYDSMLIEWAKTAKPGDMCKHRMGWMFCVNKEIKEYVA